MTTEELLMPRWKVIADFPGGASLKIGDIIEGGGNLISSDRIVIMLTLTGNISSTRSVIDPSDYPAIFKKLEWWEGRNIEDMPDYIKNIITGVVYPIQWNMIKEPPKAVYIWFNRKGIDVSLDGIDQDFSLLKSYEPSIKEEYENQK